MASGLSPKIPLYVDDIDGAYALNKDFQELVKQNVKNVVLTNPGERIMDPDFGVGVRKLLFENSVAPSVYEGKVSARVARQIDRYFPYIELIDINFFEIVNTTNSVKMEIIYHIVPLDLTQKLPLEVED